MFCKKNNFGLPLSDYLLKSDITENKPLRKCEYILVLFLQRVGIAENRRTKLRSNGLLRASGNEENLSSEYASRSRLSVINCQRMLVRVE